MIKANTHPTLVQKALKALEDVYRFFDCLNKEHRKERDELMSAIRDVLVTCTVEDNRERAWLIEIQVPDGDGIMYLTFNQYGSAWVENINDAVRFSRKVDADRALKPLFDQLEYIQVCEHIWDDGKVVQKNGEGYFTGAGTTTVFPLAFVDGKQLAPDMVEFKEAPPAGSTVMVEVPVHLDPFLQGQQWTQEQIDEAFRVKEFDDGVVGD